MVVEVCEGPDFPTRFPVPSPESSPHSSFAEEEKEKRIS